MNGNIIIGHSTNIRTFYTQFQATMVKLLMLISDGHGTVGWPVDNVNISSPW